MSADIEDTIQNGAIVNAVIIEAILSPLYKPSFLTRNTQIAENIARYIGAPNHGLLDQSPGLLFIVPLAAG